MKKISEYISVFILIVVLSAGAILGCAPPAPTKYAVKFIANDQTAKTVQSAGNEVIELPAAPEIKDYEFKGWYLDKDVWQKPFTGNEYADKAITAGFEVYAKYDYVPPAPTKYYVEFVTNDGSEVETVYVSVIEESPVTTKPGFDFEGWFEDPEFTTQAEFPYYPTKNTVLYAKWQQSTTVFTLNEDNEISGVSGVPADGIITIPAYVNGVKVAGIAYKAFEYNEQIKQVTVAEEITSFGPKCFRNCVNLTSVKISDKTTVISDFMFDGCKSLKQFDFPDSLVQIRSNGFSNTLSLIHI